MKIKLAGVVLAFSMVLVAASPLTSAEEPPPEGDMLDSVLDSLLMVPAESVSQEFPYPQLGSCLRFTITPLEPLLLALSPTLTGVLRLVAELFPLLRESPEMVEELLDRIILRVVADPSIVVNLIELILGGIVRLSILNPLTWPQDPNCVAIVGACDPTNPLGSCQSILYQVSWIGSSILRGLPIQGLSYLVSALPALL